MKTITIEINDDKHYNALIPTFADILIDFVEEFKLEATTIPNTNGIKWTIGEGDSDD